MNTEEQEWEKYRSILMDDEDIAFILSVQEDE